MQIKTGKLARLMCFPVYYITKAMVIVIVGQLQLVMSDIYGWGFIGLSMGMGQTIPWVSRLPPTSGIGSPIPVNAMPQVQSYNFWKVKEKERKWRRKRREGEWKGIEWGKSNIKRLPKGLQTHLGFLT